jgi:flagellar basal body-associated protein FliL
MEPSVKKSMFGRHRKIIIGSLILLSIIILIYLLNGYAGYNNVKMVSLENKSSKENTNPLRKNKVVVTAIHMGAGNDDLLGLVLASPYASIEQQSQLYKYSSQIKNDFLMTVSEEQLKQWIKNRDFDDIKARFKKIVNQYLDDPVPEVFISSYFYE